MFLGIDIGTTKIAVVLIDDEGKCIESITKNIRTPLIRPWPDTAEQVADEVIDEVFCCMELIPRDMLGQVKAICATGQMHGVVCTDQNGMAVQRFITWQDKRVDEPFLSRLYEKTLHTLHQGYGCATLSWLAEMDALPNSVCGSGTIHDYLTARMCGLKKPVTDPTDAASFGLFNIDQLDWDRTAVRHSGLNPDILPQVLECGSIAGNITAEMAKRLGINPNVPMITAIGDNQASLYATLQNPETDMALTIGTAAQASVMATERPSEHLLRSSYELRPYPDNRYIYAAPSLNGGNAWKQLALEIQETMERFDYYVHLDMVYQKLNALGLAHKPSCMDPVFHPFFKGERHDKNHYGSLENLQTDNWHLGARAYALALGLMTNLKNMLPNRALTKTTRIVGSGNALRLNPLLRHMAEEVFELPLILSQGKEEAATGAAMLAKSSFNKACAR